MPETKSQHYVPRLLLKHFCADGKTIAVTDLKTKNKYKTNIINVAQENRFYDLKTMNGDISLEKQFAGLEDKTAPIIDKIVKIESIGWLLDSDKRVVEDFILCQFYRTRKYVNHVKNILQTNNLHLFDLHGPDGNIKKSFYCNDVNIDDNFARVMSYNSLYDIEHDNVIRDAIASMEWVLFKATGKQIFITSDNPTVLNNHLAFMEDNGKTSGFDLPHSQIFLPISSKLMLVLTAGTMAEESRTRLLKIMMRGIPVVISDAFRCSVTGEAARCPDALVKVFNESQKRNAERFIYGNDK